MRFLIDTHCWLWYLLSPEKLAEDARELLQNPEHEIYLSAASAWEIQKLKLYDATIVWAGS